MAASTVADSTDDVPRPLPAGMAESSVISMPPPKARSCCSRLPYLSRQNCGTKPERASAAFGMLKGEPTFLKSLMSSKVCNTSMAPKSMERNTICVSFVGLIYTCMGCCPFNSIAMLTTAPPSMRQYGGVSVQPPPKSMRTGDLLHTIWSE